MLTLYYSPGACSLASHIALEETGAAYEEKRVVLANGEHKTPEYMAINPRARVPALAVDGTVITENLAVLAYIAKRFPEAGLLPQNDPLAEARCLSLMAFCSSTVHPAFAHIFRPERFADDTAAHPALKETGRRVFHDYLKEIDGLLAGKTWAMGDQFTLCDPYILVFYWWGMRIELPVTELANYTAHKQRMLARPAVRRVIEREGIALA